MCISNCKSFVIMACCHETCAFIIFDTHSWSAERSSQCGSAVCRTAQQMLAYTCAEMAPSRCTSRRILHISTQPRSRQAKAPSAHPQKRCDLPAFIGVVSECYFLFLIASNLSALRHAACARLLSRVQPGLEGRRDGGLNVKAEAAPSMGKDFLSAFPEGTIEILDSPVRTPVKKEGKLDNRSPSVDKGKPPQQRSVKTEAASPTSGSANAACASLVGKTEAVEEEEEKPLASLNAQVVPGPPDKLQVATQADCKAARAAAKEERQLMQQGRDVCAAKKLDFHAHWFPRHKFSAPKNHWEAFSLPWRTGKSQRTARHVRSCMRTLSLEVWRTKPCHVCLRLRARPHVWSAWSC